MNQTATKKQMPGWGWTIIALGVLVHFGVSFFYSTQHFFIPDEVVYMLMNEALSHGRFALNTGYEEFASSMFIFGLSVMHDGKVQAQYPVYYAFLSLPFYLAAGKVGLIWINQLCFLAILWLVFRIQKLLFESIFSAWMAVLLSVFGGYLWVYSQTIAPHLLQATLLLLSAWLFIRAFLAQTKCISRDYLLSGLIMGIALGVRYDSLFALPMLFLPLFFANPIRWRGIGLLLPGLVLSIIGLSIVNQIKFGTWMPFTYESLDKNERANFRLDYIVIALAGMVVLAAVWFATRLHAKGRLPSTKSLVLGAGLLLAVAFFLTAEWVGSLFYGFILTVFDFSSLPMNAELTSSATRTETGGYMYFGEYKRALVQSAPFISLVGLLALQVKLKFSRRELVSILWLALVPMAFIFFFSYLKWDGGFAYHMRYYTPLLPFFAMIVAQVFFRLKEACGLKNPSQWLSPMAVGAVLSFVAVAITSNLEDPSGQREWMMLYFPLWLWIAVFVSGVFAFYDGAGAFMKQLCIMVCAFTMTWGGASTLFIVYPHLDDYKAMLIDMSESYKETIGNDAVVVSVPRYFTTLLGQQDRKLRIATIFDDGQKVTKEDMRDMVEHFMANDVPVYITHDMASYPIIKQDVKNWNIRLQQVRGRDEEANTPPISQFVPAVVPSIMRRKVTP